VDGVVTELVTTGETVEVEAETVETTAVPLAELATAAY